MCTEGRLAVTTRGRCQPVRLVVVLMVRAGKEQTQDDSAGDQEGRHRFQNSLWSDRNLHTASLGLIPVLVGVFLVVGHGPQFPGQPHGREGEKHHRDHQH